MCPIFFEKIAAASNIGCGGFYFLTDISVYGWNGEALITSIILLRAYLRYQIQIQRIE